MDLSHRDPCVAVQANESVAALMNSSFRDALHRMVVLQGNLLVGLVSQTDLVSFLFKNSRDLKVMVSQLKIH